MVGLVPISTAPALDPAMIDRNALGLSFFFSGSLACCKAAILKCRCCGKSLIECSQLEFFGVCDDGASRRFNISGVNSE